MSSWEIGTRQKALLELNSPSLYLYSVNSIPPVVTASDALTDVWASVDSVLAEKPAGILPFFKDTAIGDPASMLPFPWDGVEVLTRRSTRCWNCLPYS